jgi:hypothetical protein
MLGSQLVSSALVKKPKQQQALGAEAQAILVNDTNTVESIPVIYGQRRIGGSRVLAHVSGKSGKSGMPDATNAYLHIVLVHCEGEIFIGGDYQIDNKDVTSYLSTQVQYTLHKGADAQVAAPDLITAAPTIWTSAHKLSGVCYSHLVFKYDTATFPQVPTVTVNLSGRTVYDPRTGMTVWSDNPAICIRDYLTNARYGRGVSSSDIDDANFIVAANYCDELVAKLPSGTEKRYRCNAVIDTSQPALDNLERLLATCRGMLVFSGGKYRLRIDKPETATFTFNESNIVGAWSIKLGDKRTRFNRVRATWIDPANQWQAAMIVRDSATYRTADNGLMLEAQIEYPYVTSSGQAQRLTDMHLVQSRFGISCAFRATIAGLLCEVGDVVNITHATPGWTNKPFRIRSISLMASDEVEVVCNEYDASVYVANPLTAERVSVATNLPALTLPLAPTGLTLASGITHAIANPDGIVIPRLHAAWTLTDAYAHQVEVWFRRSGTVGWQPTVISATESSVYLSPVEVGVTHEVIVRSVNLIGVSPWLAGSHTVTGEDSKPNNLPIDVQVFTTSGTWSKPNRGRLIKIEVWGAGGAGGSGGVGPGGGGGGGLYVTREILFSAAHLTEAVQVGAGGASVTDGIGPNGGSSSFGLMPWTFTIGWGGQGGAWGIEMLINPGGAGGGSLISTSQGHSNHGKNGAGNGAGIAYGVYLQAGSSTVAGGGGGSGRTESEANGGSSTYGGGGGGGGSDTLINTGGTSLLGGAGGNGDRNVHNNYVAALAGTAPGGGGGGSCSTYPSGAGGNGMVKVTVW